MRTLSYTAFVLATLVVSFVLPLGHAEGQGVRANAPTFGEFVGVNGHTVLFRPDLYRKVCFQVRDYHPIDWDFGDDTDFRLEFPFARNRVNWDQVYGSWKKAGFTVDVCLMFDNFAASKWKSIDEDAYRYGKAFAENFGPRSKTPWVHSVEIGNEPGKYSDDEFRRLFQAMARGLREGDPDLLIATCNVNVGKSGDYHKSVECVAGLESLYDILNIHSYAMLEMWPTFKRSYPEDTRLLSYVQDIDKLIDWRDKHASGKKIWLTEFGWDASSKQPLPQGDFAKWQGNNDIEQAQWLVRSLMVFAKRDVERAFIYFFNDEDQPQFHGSSGLTRNFEPKPSFYAVGHAVQALAEFRLAKILQENDEACIYEFQHTTNLKSKCWVAWSPTGNQLSRTVSVKSPSGKFSRAERMPLKEHGDLAVVIPSSSELLHLPVTESPLYLFFE